MNKFLRSVGLLVVFGTCFVGAKTLVQSLVANGGGTYETPAELREALLTEASESGVDQESILEVADDMETMLNSSDTRAKLTAAYGSVSGSDAEIARQFDSDPERRHRVGYALEEVILGASDFPIRLDEITLYTGVHYEKEGTTMVYHYDIEEDWSWMSDDQLDTVQSEINKTNPNSVCEMSLSALAQGFDMAYRYRDATGAELFRITRTYSQCEFLGY